MRLLKKYLLICAGFISVALGIMGIFLPLLPTTPFLLLAAFCFIRSSNRWYLWLMQHRTFGKYIDNYLKHRSVPLKTKISALILMWVSITISILLVDILYLRIILLAVATGVSIHLLSLRVLRSETKPEESLEKIGENTQIIGESE